MTGVSSSILPFLLSARKGEIAALLRAILGPLPADRVWVNPDCGLKTRAWEEVAHALAHLVVAAQRLRAGHS